MEQNSDGARWPWSRQREVVVIGGGLAGLTAAYWLAKAGRTVTLYESRDLLGGKARSFGGPMQKRPIQPYVETADLDDFNPMVDKGYHIFPDWYWELWTLVDEVGAADNFYPRKKVKGKKSPEAGDYALFMPPLEDLSFEGDPRDGAARSRVANEKALVPAKPWRLWEWGPLISMVLTAMGLVSSSGRTVEEMTVPDFISTRWYNGNERASVLQDLIVKALANPSRHTSAYTMRQMFRRWLPTLAKGNPWTPPNGPLQTCLIDPIVAGCLDRGVKVERGELTCIHRNEDFLTELVFADGERLDVEDADVIVALPPDVLLEIAKRDEDMATLRPIARLTHLRSAPMGAIDLYFVDPDSVDDYPEHLRPDRFTSRHFSLIESEFGLTGFPISRVPGWQDHLDGAPGLVLQFVAGNVLDVHHYPDDRFARLLIDEIAEYLGFDPARHLYACVPLPSSDEQLTMNDAGTWDSRPPANIPEVENLYLAGDFVKLAVDVAGMEAAVESGANAARAVLLTTEIRRMEAGVVGAYGQSSQLTRKELDSCHDNVARHVPVPHGPPPRWHGSVLWPACRLVFSLIGHTLGWFVLLARAPLKAGTDMVAGLNDRYEDHRSELVEHTVAGPRVPTFDSSVGIVTGTVPGNADPQPRGLRVTISRHDRRRGFGDPMVALDRLLIAGGLVATFLGFLSAFVLATRVEGYSHIDDAISVLGRHEATRAGYVLVTITGWVLFQLFAAVVRRFTPGSQVLVWGLSWLGFLWAVVGLLPICPDDGAGGTTCGGGWARAAELGHIVAAIGMASLLTVLPLLAARQVLVRLPMGYELDWAPFRRFSQIWSVVTVVSGAWFALTLFGAGPSGLAQRMHWAAGHVWVVGLAVFLLVRRHQRIDRGGNRVGAGPLRSVDQRSLWT